MDFIDMQYREKKHLAIQIVLEIAILQLFGKLTESVYSEVHFCQFTTYNFTSLDGPTFSINGSTIDVCEGNFLGRKLWFVRNVYLPQSIYQEFSENAFCCLTETQNVFWIFQLLF